MDRRGCGELRSRSVVGGRPVQQRGCVDRFRGVLGGVLNNLALLLQDQGELMAVSGWSGASTRSSMARAPSLV